MLDQKTVEYLNRCCKGKSVRGKVVIVTGANSGIGFKATEELVFLGAKVIMACRNLEKAGAAREKILAEHPSAQIEIRQLDIASKVSINLFVDGIRQDGVDIYALVNNAGVFGVNGTTEDGLDTVTGTNYFGTRVLVEMILPYLRGLGHQVTVTVTSSISYKMTGYGPTSFRTYAKSKLQLTRYGIELAKSLAQTNVKVVLTHPGISMTAMSMKVVGRFKMDFFAPAASRFFQSPERSALAIPFVLTNPFTPGTLYGPSGFAYGWGFPSQNKIGQLKSL